MPDNKPKVGLFVTCLVDVFRPMVAFAAVKLLEEAGCSVYIPKNQTCCGQPAYNGGYVKIARRMAVRVMKSFDAFDYTILPSGSCAAMMKNHYPHLFKANSPLSHRAQRFSGKVFELVSFLSDIMKVGKVPGSYTGTVTYHDSCSGLRELGIKSQPRQLLERIPGLQIEEMKKPEVCCGFGGTFCFKFPEISDRMSQDKVMDIQNTGADSVLSGDMGCLLNITAALKRAKVSIDARHVAEILAGLDGEQDRGRKT